MAGRRLRYVHFMLTIIPVLTLPRNTVQQAITSSSAFSSVKNPLVVVAGPANTYSHYVTTREEYGVQRYEGASTIYGPSTLEAYQDIFTKLVPYVADTPPSAAAHSDPAPPDQSASYVSLQVAYAHPHGRTCTDKICSDPSCVRYSAYWKVIRKCLDERSVFLQSWAASLCDFRRSQSS